MKLKSRIVNSGRTRSLFNTGTRPHKSPKDYTRKLKHKKRPERQEDPGLYYFAA